MNTFQTRTGHTIYVRPILASDTPFLVDIFTHMSPESRYQRFQTTGESVPSERILLEAERIAQADPSQQQGLIALVIGDNGQYTAVGAGRFVRLEDPLRAEFAMSIRDDYQRMGIGQTLLHLIVAQAQAQGIKRLVSFVQHTNTAAFALLRHVAVPFERRVEDDITVIELLLNA
jgi:acetyltransferase